MKHLKKLKTRMGSFQLKSLVDLATDKKGKNISFDVAESVNEALFSKDQIEIMRKSYGTLSRINPFSPTYKKFIKFLEKLPKDQLKQLANAKIKFVSILAKNRLKGESVNENSEKAVKDMIKRGIVKKGQSEKVRVKAIKIWIDKYSDEYKKGAYPDPWKRRLKLGHGGKVQDWWGDTMHIASKMLKESVNEANMKDIEKVLKKRQAKKIDGMYMDMTTANAIMTVYKALNTTNKKKFAKLPLKKMVTVTWKLVK
jgi:hypothetical protein